MLRDQLYLARQLYRGHRPPSLANSNYEAVRVAAAELTSADFSTFALMADLTSFVQVGDLLVVNRETGMTIAEVKQGAVNERILQVLHAATQPERDAACGCYLACAPGIFGGASVFMSAAQLGHGVQVAERHDLASLKQLPKTAATLEAAMQIETEIAAALHRVSTRPVTGRVAS